MGHAHGKQAGTRSAAAPAQSQAPAAASAGAHAPGAKPRPPLVGGTSSLATDEDLDYLWRELGDDAPGCSAVPLYSSAASAQAAADAPDAPAGADDEETSPSRPCWRLLYSSERHGRSFLRLRQSVTAEGRTLVLVRDAAGTALFGGLTDTWLEPVPRFYGSERTAVFALQPQRAIYRGKGFNDHYQFLYARTRGEDTEKEPEEKYYGMGMGGQIGFFAWCFDENLEMAACRGYPANTTFGCPPLCGGPQGGEFALGDVEVWCVADPPREQKILAMLVRKRKAAGEAVLGGGSVIDREIMSMAGHTFYSDQLEPAQKDQQTEDAAPQPAAQPAQQPQHQ